MLGAAMVSKRTAKNVLTFGADQHDPPRENRTEISCDDDDRR
jgi:hypothetical protein